MERSKIKILSMRLSPGCTEFLLVYRNHMEDLLFSLSIAVTICSSSKEKCLLLQLLVPFVSSCYLLSICMTSVLNTLWDFQRDCVFLKSVNLLKHLHLCASV